MRIVKFSVVAVFFLVCFGSVVHSKAPYVGMEYETWFLSATSGEWNNRKVTPLRGTYSSHDPQLVRAHIQQIQSLGVDFLLVDWSNQADPSTWPNRPDLNGIVTATDLLFDTIIQMQSPLQIAILLDCNHPDNRNNGWLQETADIMYTRYLSGDRARVYFQLYQKPLLLVYTNTPSWNWTCSNWNDNRFTLRFSTGFTEAQPGTEGAGLWSWVSRNPVGINRQGNIIEEMTVSPATCQYGPWPGAGGRDNGNYYSGQWQQVLSKKPSVVLICQWNEYAEETSPECSNEVEPTVEYNDLYMQLSKKFITQFKSQ